MSNDTAIDGAIDTAIDTVGDLVGGAVDTAGRAVGHVVQAGSDMVADGLHAIGFDDAGAAATRFGEDASSASGNAVAEMALGQSSEPTELVHGDTAGIDAAAAHLNRFSAAFGRTADGLSGLDTAHWTGDAADAFRARFDPQPAAWSAAQHACASTGAAMASYGGTVRWAQEQAGQAIAAYEQAQQATAAAQARYAQDVTTYNQAADVHNAALAAGIDPGLAPTMPAAFTDPGAAGRETARQTLDRARAHRDAAAVSAASAVAAATDTAPPPPSTGQKVLDTLGDLGAQAQDAQTHIAGGVVKGAGDLLRFARSLNPTDPYNLTHPAQFVDGVSTTAAGLVHAVDHPAELVKGVVGTGWGTDPFESFGRLLPNLAQAVATDGAGTAATVGERAAVGVGERAAIDAVEDVASSATRQAAGDAVANARPPGEMRCVGDPIDTATGAMVLPQTDVELPGSLPLAFERTHLSSYRSGGWFGPSWASTVDQRLEVDSHGVLFCRADGVVLFYPPPGDDPVLPEQGARWPLARAGAGYTVTDPATGHVRTFDHAAGTTFRIRSVEDRNGRRVAFGYGPDGAPSSIRHSGGYYLRLSSAEGRVTALSLVDGLAEVPVMRYRYTDGALTEVIDSSDAPLRLRYDAAGRIVEWVDRTGGWYRYRYDEAGRCAEVTGADGYLSGRFEYDPVARTTVHVDAVGATRRFAFDERLRLVAETDPLGHTTRSRWDPSDRLLAVTDPLGRSVGYEYGPGPADGPVAVRRPDGARTEITYGPLDLPVRIVDADGSTRTTTYDAAGNPLTETDPTGATTHFAYDARGHLAAVTDPLGAVTHVECDAAGLPVAVTDPRGGVTRYRRDAFGRVVAHVDPVGGETTLGWTVEGRPAWRRDPGGGVERWVHDREGNPVEHVDQVGNRTASEYTRFDTVSARVAADGSRTKFGHDGELRLRTVTNPLGLVWRYHHDAAGRLVGETDFDGRERRYELDAAGQTVRSVNGAGEVTEFRYDALGNVVEQVGPAGRTTFGYDRAGRLVHARNGDAELVIERDRCGRVLAETVDGRTVRSRYDAAGRRVHRRTPSGAESRWEFDGGGAPVALRTAGRELRFAHDAAGREEWRWLGDVVGLAQTWDPAHRLTGQALVGVTPGQRRTFRYRPDGALSGVDDLVAGPSRYDLDAMGRVTAAHHQGGRERYAYDRLGTVATTGVRYRYDAQGRVTQRRCRRLTRKARVWRYTWDGDDRLTDVVTPDGSHWHYRYDPLGRRIAKQRLSADGTVLEQTDFTWDGSTLVEQSDRGGRVVTWNHHPRSAQPLTQSERGQDWYDQRFYAIVTDLVGTPTELVDENGALAWHGRTSLWGLPRTPSNGTATTPLRFPGQYLDDETGLHYNLHRYYDPHTARYLSTDPLGLAPAPNPTAYVHNPLTWADPLGLAPCGRIDPMTVRFSQDSVKPFFMNGNSIEETVARLRAGTLSADEFPAIRLVQRDSNLYTLDNRRLVAFQQAALTDIPYVMATLREARREMGKFDDIYKGLSIKIRGGGGMWTP